jgi:hypothetical protein
MADNYLQYSEMLPANDEEKAWFEAAAQKMQEMAEDTGEFFNVEYQLESGADGIWIFSEEGGNIDSVAELVQAFLKQFRPNGCWGMTWSETCSKLRIGEFSGGAVFVTANKIEYRHASSWVEEMKNKFEAKHAKKRGK